ncbi:hypothetical protein [Novacetimonas maltaceti]|nr:hypothetical protein [Novacetimonas maltaceti]
MTARRTGTPHTDTDMPMPPTPQTKDQTTPDTADVAGIRAHLHDIRGLLSPAMMQADILSAHPDARVRAGAEAIIKAIEATVGRMDQIRRTCLPARRKDE